MVFIYFLPLTFASFKFIYLFIFIERITISLLFSVKGDQNIIIQNDALPMSSFVYPNKRRVPSCWFYLLWDPESMDPPMRVRTKVFPCQIFPFFFF